MLVTMNLSKYRDPIHSMLEHNVSIEILNCASCMLYIARMLVIATLSLFVMTTWRDSMKTAIVM